MKKQITRPPWLMQLRNMVGAVVVLAAAFDLVLPVAALATTTNWPQDTTLLMTGPGITLKVLAGSKSDSLVVTGTTFTLTVANGDSFTVQYPGPNPGVLTNNGSLQDCNLISGNNQVTYNGPVSGVVFTPSTTPCVPRGGGANVPPSVSVVQPNGGTFNAGAQTQIIWGTSGPGIYSLRLSLSTDGGASFVTFVDNLPVPPAANSGSYLWTVPSIATTSTARIRIEAKDNGGMVIASAMSSSNLTISGAAVVAGGGGGGGGGGVTPPAPQPPAPQPQTYPVGTHDPVPLNDAEKAAPANDPNATGSGYTAGGATNATPSINVDKGIIPPPSQQLPCIGDTLIKVPDQSAVYYCGKNGKRYVFPNQATYLSWFQDFSSVHTISNDSMAAIPIGGNVTYRPGVRMVKIQTDPKTYAVARSGLLRWVQSEAAAARLYGPLWNKQIDDVSDAFFVNYKMGDPIQ